MPQLRPIGGSTFVFGAKPGGFDARFYANGQDEISGAAVLDGSKQGPPGHAHGGALAALLDEAMGAAAWVRGYQVVAAHLDFDYKRPVPLGVEVRIAARISRKEGRKVYTAGEIILPDGAVAMEGSGIFVEAPHYFDNAGYTPLTTREPDPD